MLIPVLRLALISVCQPPPARIHSVQSEWLAVFQSLIQVSGFRWKAGNESSVVRYTFQNAKKVSTWDISAAYDSLSIDTILLDATWSLWLAWEYQMTQLVNCIREDETLLQHKRHSCLLHEWQYLFPLTNMIYGLIWKTDAVNNKTSSVCHFSDASMTFHALWKVAGALLKPDFIGLFIFSPLQVTNAVLPLPILSI